MPERTATARWEGGLQGGKGTMRLGSGAFEGQYSFSSRFEEGTGTNPEELIGAAHAGCFSMALSGATRARRPCPELDRDFGSGPPRARRQRLSHLTHRALHHRRRARHRRRRLPRAGGDRQEELSRLAGPRRRGHPARRPPRGLTPRHRTRMRPARARATRELEHEVHLPDDGAAERVVAGDLHLAHVQGRRRVPPAEAQARQRLGVHRERHGRRLGWGRHSLARPPFAPMAMVVGRDPVTSNTTVVPSGGPPSSRRRRPRARGRVRTRGRRRGCRDRRVGRPAPDVLLVHPRVEDAERQQVADGAGTHRRPRLGIEVATVEPASCATGPGDLEELGQRVGARPRAPRVDEALVAQPGSFFTWS